MNTYIIRQTSGIFYHFLQYLCPIGWNRKMIFYHIGCQNYDRKIFFKSAHWWLRKAEKQIRYQLRAFYKVTVRTLADSIPFIWFCYISKPASPYFPDILKQRFQSFLRQYFPGNALRNDRMHKNTFVLALQPPAIAQPMQKILFIFLHENTKVSV